MSSIVIDFCLGKMPRIRVGDHNKINLDTFLLQKMKASMPWACKSLSVVKNDSVVFTVEAQWYSQDKLCLLTSKTYVYRARPNFGDKHR